jgi:hypothetical protein
MTTLHTIHAVNKHNGQSEFIYCPIRKGFFADGLEVDALSLEVLEEIYIEALAALSDSLISKSHYIRIEAILYIETSELLAAAMDGRQATICTCIKS